MILVLKLHPDIMMTYLQTNKEAEGLMAQLIALIYASTSIIIGEILARFQNLANRLRRQANETNIQ